MSGFSFQTSVRHWTILVALLIGGLLAALAAAGLGLEFDSFNTPLAFLYLGLTITHVLTVPKRKLTLAFLLSIASMLAGTLLVYLASTLPVLLVGWVLSSLPIFLFRPVDGERGGLPAYAHAISALALLAAIFLVDSPSMSRPAFVAFTLAVVFRKGIFPAQSSVAAAFERKPLWLANLTENGHLGAVLVVRFAIPLLAEEARSLTSVISDLALLTAISSAIIALVEKSPRRLLAWLYLSQASIILAGIESANTPGITGALIQMMVVTVASSILAISFECVEARYGHSMNLGEYHGLAGRIPRLGAFFLIAGLALVGLPGTLGFCAEDLLLHGTLESHPTLGIILPMTTALNAWNLVRFYSRIFLGRNPRLVPSVSDALPRESAPLTVFAVALVVFGLAPNFIIHTREGAGERLAHYLTAATAKKALPNE